MTGSSLAPIVIPIVVTIALASWLAIVFYAAAHPGWKTHAASSRPAVTEAGEHAEPSGQAQPERALAAAAPGGNAVEPGTAGDHGQAAPAAPRRAA